MTSDSLETTNIESAKPTIALLGEFSSGKSTLANVLMNVAKSPVRVTATQVPPIWYALGSGPAVHVTTDGIEHDLSSADFTDLSLKETRVVRVPLASSILHHCTIIDMPGSSDPNMAPDTWDALLPEVDIVIWCTPACQAWRQSEAAVWDLVPEDLRKRSLLAVTRMDKLSTQDDRSKLIRRVEREVDGLFEAILPLSLLDAQGPKDRRDISGVPQLVTALKSLLWPSRGLQKDHLPDHASEKLEKLPVRPTTLVMPRRVSAKQIVRRSVGQRPDVGVAYGD